MVAAQNVKGPVEDRDLPLMTSRGAPAGIFALSKLTCPHRDRDQLTLVLDQDRTCLPGVSIVKSEFFTSRWSQR